MKEYEPKKQRIKIKNRKFLCNELRLNKKKNKPEKIDEKMREADNF